MLSKRIWFAINILMVCISSSLLLSFMITLTVVLPNIILTGNNPILPDKGTFMIYTIIGVIIESVVLIAGVKGLWGMTKSREISLV